ncbi:pilus assembly protein [Duganella dendranthematis]|jgi:Flp pilus assembly protein TadG|uniref:Pilus assembly protein n=1 Tax=Duganella dendranthematis TaxID=2728021 RepID=A0ABX6M480_9BURK|nr:TadE family protein [Duganella dendranthematis]QJD89125.1 pilus assembly protein [Duganella dendranthematis]
MKAMRQQCGAVALELALTLGFLFPVAAMLLFYGRVLYNYEVAQKAAHDAVRHMASANVLNINNNAMVGFEVAVAQAIVREEVSVLNPSVLGVSVACDGLQCLGLGVPTTVTVGVQIKVRNQMYGYAPELADQNITATQSMRYVGN